MEKLENSKFIVKNLTEIGEEKVPTSLFDILNEGVLIIDENYKVKFKNQALRNMLPETSNLCYELYGKNKPCRNCPLKRRKERLSRVIKLKNKLLEVNAKRLVIDGKIQIIETVRDVTETEILKKELKRTEEKFWNLFENAGDGIVLFDKDGRVIAANKKCEEITGFKRRNYIGKLFTEFLVEKQFPKAFKASQTLLDGNPIRIEFEVKHAKKKAVIIEVTCVPLKRHGKLTGALGIIRDVTEKRKLEQKLREYSRHLERLIQVRTKELEEIERRYSVLLEQAGDGVIVIQDGLLAFVNKKMEKLVGYPKEQLLGKPFTLLVAPEYVNIVKERYEKRMKGENVPQIYEVEVVSKNGERIPFETNATKINLHGKPADIVIFRDLRTRKLMEQKLLKSERLATIGKFATLMAHDLRNPLTSILNAAYYLKFTLKKSGLDGQMREMVEIIGKNVEYVSNTINDLLDFVSSKKPRFTKVNLHRIINEVLSSFKITNNVIIVKKFGKISEITADPSRLRRVFYNLIENALQAMPNGGKLTIETVKAGDFVKISISDTGVGIPIENMQKIFTPFFTTKSKGIGMGLAVCKKLIEEHKGVIEVKSREGSGSTFIIKLPINMKEVRVVEEES